eukprot:CAMPEP_0184490350 /NCGR_PEP_ID=MMETSP0113_2-20130426/17696_1 /TAXON_ID=91329 /ORGANISM="Norrisiella sphaerica, Strain BC52" /LENGTH=252 /DNA_ID=CAMNT_0026874203 /DNA_START=218 /DNA_END=976 /DNA_ORIENTATION=-
MFRPSPYKRRRQRLLTLFCVALVASATLLASSASTTGVPDGRELQFSFSKAVQDSEWVWPPVLLSAFLGLLYWKYKPADMGNVIDVQSERELVQYMTNSEGRTVVVDFTSDSCPYCDLIAPVFGKISKNPKYKDKAIFLSLNVAKFQQVMMEAGVQATPTFVAYRNMKVIQRISGPPANKLEKYIDQVVFGQTGKKKSKKRKSKPAATNSGGYTSADEGSMARPAERSNDAEPVASLNYEVVEPEAQTKDAS